MIMIAIIDAAAPPSNCTSTEDPNAMTKTNRLPAKIPGAVSGITTCRRVCHQLAPRSSLASSTDPSMRVIERRIGKIMNGRYEASRPT